MKKNVDITDLDRVINTTIDAVENGQKEMFSIYEHAKQECDRIEVEESDRTSEGNRQEGR